MLDRTFKREEHVFWFCLGFAQATESQMAKAWKMSEKLQSQRPRRPLEASIFVPPCDILRHPATPCDLRLHLAAFHGQVRTSCTCRDIGRSVLRLFGCLNGTSMQSTPPGHSNVCSSMGSQGPRVKRCASVAFGCLCCSICC